MKFEVGKFYKSRGGDKVRVICVDANGAYPVIGLRVGRLVDFVEEYCAGGQYVDWSDAPDDNDLVAEWREPVTICGYVNFYDDSQGLPYHTSMIYRSREDADRHAGSSRIACVYVSGEEGVDP